jgi:hypothetical protein
MKSVTRRIYLSGYWSNTRDPQLRQATQEIGRFRQGLRNALQAGVQAPHVFDLGNT